MLAVSTHLSKFIDRWPAVICSTASTKRIYKKWNKQCHKNCIFFCLSVWNVFLHCTALLYPIFYWWFWCRSSGWLRIIKRPGSENHQKWSYSPSKFCNFFSLAIKTLPVHLLCNWMKTSFLGAMFMVMLIFQRCNYFMSISIARSFNKFKYSLLHVHFQKQPIAHGLQNRCS